MKDLRVRVFLENQELILFIGAEVRHALIAYDDQIYRQALLGEIAVCDEWGNELGLNGAVTEGVRLFIKGR